MPSADAAIASVARLRPDLVVLDLYLPDGGAMMLMRRWQVETPGLQVVFVSDTSSLGNVVRAMSDGMWSFEKPLHCDRMFDELEQRIVIEKKSDDGTESHCLGSAILDPAQVDRFFAVSPGLLAVLGFDGYFKMLNPAWTRALGYSIEELCATPHLEWIHPDDRAKASDEALDVRDGYAVYRFKNRYRCKDGRYRWLEWSATPSPRDRVVYASARDVTTTVELELLLRTSNAKLMGIISDGEQLLHESSVTNTALAQEGHERDEMAALLVHDLKSPLSVILAN